MILLDILIYKSLQKVSAWPEDRDAAIEEHRKLIVLKRVRYPREVKFSNYSWLYDQKEFVYMLYQLNKLQKCMSKKIIDTKS